MTRPDRIHLERRLPHPRAAVWRALTVPELHARWWAAGDVQPIVGHRFELDMGAWGKQACLVLEVVPEVRFRYAFATGRLDTTITWELSDDGDGTRLVLTHEGFDLDAPLARQALEGMGRGWPGVIDRLAALLAAR